MSPGTGMLVAIFALATPASGSTADSHWNARTYSPRPVASAKAPASQEALLRLAREHVGMLREPLTYEKLQDELHAMARSPEGAKRYLALLLELRDADSLPPEVGDISDENLRAGISTLAGHLGLYIDSPSSKPLRLPAHQLWAKFKDYYVLSDANPALRRQKGSEKYREMALDLVYAMIESRSGPLDEAGKRADLGELVAYLGAIRGDPLPGMPADEWTAALDRVLSNLAYKPPPPPPYRFDSDGYRSDLKVRLGMDRGNKHRFGWDSRYSELGENDRALETLGRLVVIEDLLQDTIRPDAREFYVEEARRLKQRLASLDAQRILGLLPSDRAKAISDLDLGRAMELHDWIHHEDSARDPGEKRARELRQALGTRPELAYLARRYPPGRSRAAFLDAWPDLEEILRLPKQDAMRVLASLPLTELKATREHVARLAEAPGTRASAWRALLGRMDRGFPWARPLSAYHPRGHNLIGWEPASHRAVARGVLDDYTGFGATGREEWLAALSDGDLRTLRWVLREASSKSPAVFDSERNWRILRFYKDLDAELASRGEPPSESDVFLMELQTALRDVRGQGLRLSSPFDSEETREDRPDTDFPKVALAYRENLRRAVRILEMRLALTNAYVSSYGGPPDEFLIRHREELLSLGLTSQDRFLDYKAAKQAQQRIDTLEKLLSRLQRLPSDQLDVLRALQLLSDRKISGKSDARATKVTETIGLPNRNLARVEVRAGESIYRILLPGEHPNVNSEIFLDLYNSAYLLSPLGRLGLDPKRALANFMAGIVQSHAMTTTSGGPRLAAALLPGLGSPSRYFRLGSKYVPGPKAPNKLLTASAKPVTPNSAFKETIPVTVWKGARGRDLPKIREDYLGKGYVRVGDREIWRSLDGKRQVRMVPDDRKGKHAIGGPEANVPWGHLHLEKLWVSPTGGLKVRTNVHVPIVR